LLGDDIDPFVPVAAAENSGGSGALGTGVGSLPLLSDAAALLMSHGLWSHARRVWDILAARSSWPPQLAAAALLSGLCAVRGEDVPPRALAGALELGWDYDPSAPALALALADAAALAGLWPHALAWARAADDAARAGAAAAVAWQRRPTRPGSADAGTGAPVEGHTASTQPAAPSPAPSLFLSPRGGGTHAGAAAAGGGGIGAQPAAADADALWPLRLGDARARGYRAPRLRGLAAARTGRWAVCWDALERAALGARWELRNTAADSVVAGGAAGRGWEAGVVVHAPSPLVAVEGITRDILQPQWDDDENGVGKDGGDNSDSVIEGESKHNAGITEEEQEEEEKDAAQSGGSAEGGGLDAQRAALRRQAASHVASAATSARDRARTLAQAASRRNSSDADIETGALAIALPRWLSQTLRSYDATRSPLDEASARVLAHCRTLTLAAHARATRAAPPASDSDAEAAAAAAMATLEAGLRDALHSADIAAAETAAGTGADGDAEGDLRESVAEARRARLRAARYLGLTDAPISFLQWAQLHPGADLAGTAAEGAVVIATPVPVALTVFLWHGSGANPAAPGDGSLLLTAPGFQLRRLTVELMQFSIVPQSAAARPAATAAAAATAASGAGAAWTSAGAVAGAAAAATAYGGAPASVLSATLSLTDPRRCPAGGHWAAAVSALASGVATGDAFAALSGAAAAGAGVDADARADGVAAATAVAVAAAPTEYVGIRAHKVAAAAAAAARAAAAVEAAESYPRLLDAFLRASGSYSPSTAPAALVPTPAFDELEGSWVPALAAVGAAAWVDLIADTPTSAETQALLRAVQSPLAHALLAAVPDVGATALSSAWSPTSLPAALAGSAVFTPESDADGDWDADVAALAGPLLSGQSVVRAGALRLALAAFGVTVAMSADESSLVWPIPLRTAAPLLVSPPPPASPDAPVGVATLLAALPGVRVLAQELRRRVPTSVLLGEGLAAWEANLRRPTRAECAAYGADALSTDGSGAEAAVALAAGPHVPVVGNGWCAMTSLGHFSLSRPGVRPTEETEADLTPLIRALGLFVLALALPTAALWIKSRAGRSGGKLA
jgi:hypothetical protein